MTTTDASTTAPARSRRAVPAILVLAIAATGAAAFWQQQGAPQIVGESSTYVMDPQPVSAFPLAVGVGTEEHEPVTLTDWDVPLGDNSARASVQLVRCTERPVAEGTLRVGYSTADLDELCTEVVPVRDGTRLDGGAEPPQYLIALVSPTRPGTFRLESIEVTYRRGAGHLWGSVTQHADLDVTGNAS